MNKDTRGSKDFCENRLKENLRTCLLVLLKNNNNNNNNNFFILGKQIYNKIVAKIIKNNRIPKIKQTKYNIINRTKMLNRLVFHLTDQYRVQQF